MELNEFKQLVNRKKQTIFSIILVILVFTSVYLIFQPVKYQAESKILVMQDGLLADAYTISRTNEYLGNLFSQIIYSSSFYNLVMNNDNYIIDKNYFSGNDNQQLKTWRKSINTKSQGDTGIIQITVFHSNPNQARQIALAINNTLITKGHNYSGNENIKVNIIDQPLISERPVKPNIPYTLIVALFGSFILSLIFIYIFPEEKYDLKFINKRKKRKAKYKEDENNQPLILNNKNVSDENINKNKINENNDEENDMRRSELDEYYRKLSENKIKTTENANHLDGNIENLIK